MADVIGRRTTVRFPHWADRPVLPAFQALLVRELDWELTLYIALVLLSVTLRIWDVGARAMHHDESLHATYAWYLFKGRGYHYDPIMHGPLQFYVMAFFYLLFGDSETTARLFAVLCGTALVALPYFLRRELGTIGALIASLALAISPTFLYFSRFARDDVYLDFFSLLMVVGICSYLRTRQARSIYLAAAAAALAMATMEAAYIMFFMLGTFLLLMLLQERLAAPQPERNIQHILSSIGLDVWLYSIAIFIGINILLYSSFLSNPYGIFDPRYGLLSPNRQDILGGITYWLSQHGVARGGQPWFYYLLLLPLYEQFALVFGIVGAARAILCRRPFTTFLLYWFVIALAIYSWAGEKMPWLFMHPLLPATLLAATCTGDLLTNLKKPGRTLLLAVLTILLLMEVHSAQALAYADGANPTEMLVYVQTSNDVPMVAGEITRLVHPIGSSASRPLIQVDDSDLQGWPFEWYFRNLPPRDVTYTSDFAHAAAPVLIMPGPEHDLYDAGLRPHYVVSQYRWNWWFPEDYKGLTFDNGLCGTPAREVACPPGQTGTVFLKTGTPCPPTATVASNNCSLIQTPQAINVLKAATDPQTWQHLWNWFAFRTPFGTRGARMLYVYVRKDLVPSGSYTSPGGNQRIGGSELRVLTYRQVAGFGDSGSESQRVLDPHGIAVGPNGDVYVADAGNHRIVVFSPGGAFLRAFGSVGTGPGQFNVNQSPMDVAVARNGSVYVADWWGHRIEEFTPQGKFLRSWGRFGTHGAYRFYGPRSVSIGLDGRVYVADTGNRRISAFSPSGKFLYSFGSPGSNSGQFEEPSSVFAAPNGDLYVADMWNSRIQHFDAGGHFLGSWSVPSWTSGSYEEPYLTWLPNGRLLASDPQHSRLLEFSPNGRVLGAATAGFVLPIGLASSRAGTIYVADAAANKIILLGPHTSRPPSSRTSVAATTRVPHP